MSDPPGNPAIAFPVTILMKLVVEIMDFNQPVVRGDSVFEFAKIPSRWPNTGSVMQRVNQQPLLAALQTLDADSEDWLAVREALESLEAVEDLDAAWAVRQKAKEK